jgi:hypothetical protein
MKKPWKDVKLFDLKYTTANDLYKKMLDNAGVPEWAKVTHMRYDFYLSLNILILHTIYSRY